MYSSTTLVLSLFHIRRMVVLVLVHRYLTGLVSDGPATALELGELVARPVRLGAIALVALERVMLQDQLGSAAVARREHDVLAIVRQVSFTVATLLLVSTGCKDTKIGLDLKTPI